MNIYNSKGEHHGEFIERVKPPQPCTARHETFGGKCLNCGFQPTQATREGEHQLVKDFCDMNSFFTKEQAC